MWYMGLSIVFSAAINSRSISSVVECRPIGLPPSRFKLQRTTLHWLYCITKHTKSQLLGAGGALAALGLYILVKIFGVVIVVEFLSRLDVLFCHHKNLVAVYLYLAVRVAGVVDVARGVGAHRAVDSFVFIYLKKIFAAAGELFAWFKRAAAVLDNASTFFDRGMRKKPQTSFGTRYFEFMFAGLELTLCHI